jgi:hypothetical protein
VPMCRAALLRYQTFEYSVVANGCQILVLDHPSNLQIDVSYKK